MSPFVVLATIIVAHTVVRRKKNKSFWNKLFIWNIFWKVVSETYEMYFEKLFPKHIKSHEMCGGKLILKNTFWKVLYMFQKNYFKINF